MQKSIKSQSDGNIFLIYNFFKQYTIWLEKLFFFVLNFCYPNW